MGFSTGIHFPCLSCDERAWMDLCATWMSIVSGALASKLHKGHPQGPHAGVGLKMVMGYLQHQERRVQMHCMRCCPLTAVFLHYHLG